MFLTGIFEDREGEEERDVLPTEEVCNQGMMLDPFDRDIQTFTYYMIFQGHEHKGFSHFCNCISVDSSTSMTSLVLNWNADSVSLFCLMICNRILDLQLSFLLANDCSRASVAFKDGVLLDLTSNNSLSKPLHPHN